MNRTPLAAGLILLALLALGLSGLGLFSQRAALATPECPVSWPRQDHEGFFTDDAGKEWFIIRSTDSNGYATIRAYPADASYASGYAPNSPDELCYLLVRPANAAADVAIPNQIEFPREKPQPTPSPPTLRELLDRLSPSEQQSALLCLLPLAGNRTLEELNDDPEFLRQAIAHGCLTP